MTKQPKPFKNFDLEIAGRNWNIIFTEDKKALQDCDGLCCYDETTIYIDNTLRRDTQILTFWHELMHCAKRNLLLSTGPVHEEALVESDAEFLMQVLPQVYKKQKELILIKGN